MAFPRRFPSDLSPNRLSVALARMRADGDAFIDLTISNPTRAGLSYPTDLLRALGDPRGLVYAPEAFGTRDARRAIAGDFARRGMAIDADRVALTASTSEAYSLLFKVLCEAGDEVLVPRPSYPLFEHLTRLDLVVAVPYDLEYASGWQIDLPSLARACSKKTRAVLLVNPNNPTGNYVSTNELAQIAGMCRARGLAIVSDEVFADYELASGAAQDAARLTSHHDILGFTLGGLSKSIGLPQAKLAWIAMSGDEALVEQVRARLELACDTYLSVSTPVQTAAADLLEQGKFIRRQIHERVTMNYRALRSAVSLIPSCDVLRADGGWYAVLRVPSMMPEDELVLALLTEDRVLVHPGYFFDFPHESFLVVSLLPLESDFRDGVMRVLERSNGRMRR
jgi:aspartate/methionine/tyrosine aminotransferase